MVRNKWRVEVARKETIIISYRYLALAGSDGKSGVGRGPLGCWLQSVASRSLTTHRMKKGPFKFANFIRRLEPLFLSLAPVPLSNFRGFPASAWNGGSGHGGFGVCPPQMHRAQSRGAGQCNGETA